MKKIRITYEIININNILNNGESNKINKALKNIPYYYLINSYQYQQIKINLLINKLQRKPFEFLEIYEYSELYHYNKYNKFTKKSMKFFIKNKKFLTNSFTYITNSFYTKYILIKIRPLLDIEYLEVKLNIVGGSFDIDKDLMKNLTNLFAKYSYYIFVLSSKEEKLKIKFILNNNNTDIKKPFNSLNILEYSNKSSPSIYSQKLNLNLNKEYKNEIINNELFITLSYLKKNQSTNYICLEIIPDYNLSSLQCLIEKEIEENNNSSSLFSLFELLIIILIIMSVFILIVSIIYIKKVYLKSTSIEIGTIFHYKNNNDKNVKAFEMTLLLPVDHNSSLN